MKKLIILFACFLFSMASIANAGLTVTVANPIKVVASADDDEGTISTNTKKVSYFMYYGYGAAGDECEIQDTAGNTLFYLMGVASLEPVMSNRLDIKWTGFKIPTNSMDSGTLLIFTE